MKLFTPTQAKSEKAKSHEDQIAQIAYLSVTLAKLQGQINETEDAFSKRLTEQRELYTIEKEKLQREVRALESEIKSKETRLRQLMKPIDGLKEQAQETLNFAEKKLKEVIDREEEIEGLKEMLVEKLDDVSERTMSIAHNEALLENRKKGIDEESRMLSELHRTTSFRIAQVESEYQRRTRELLQRENALEAKIEANNVYLAERTAELKAKEALLNDRLKMVERDIKRINQ